ncbi:hypothetical protein V6N11_068028 [Hibiscus sabdariffa]|uniref:Uncharacterized protein n=1 Tax=Hibiscus sabdariffa TaxID=183260 RepID=A0ABR2SSI6_9ROSI
MFIYGPPYKEEKNKFWEALSSLKCNSQRKWYIIGEYNIEARQDEKVGRAPCDFSQAKWFLDFIDREFLLELPIKGGSFTWSNLRSEENTILEKLDRIIVSLE